MAAPTDALDLAVAHRAAALVWRAIPYFGHRYGERGRRFGLSDAGWLVTLAQLPADARREQINWLAGVLSPRGIPSWLLEVQLVATARAGRRLSWRHTAAFDESAAYLAERRRSVLPDAVLEQAAEEFGRRAGPGRATRVAGRLVASAHADAVLGLCPSPEPVTGWLMNADGVPPSWRSAVEPTLALVTSALSR